MKGKIKTTGQDISAGIEATAEEVTTFLGKITPDFVKDAGGILNDQVRQWRLLNAMRLVKNTQEKIEEKGYPIKQIPLKVISPLLESASLEEDQNIKEKWEDMLADAATEKKKVTPNFVEMLKELSPQEVAILDLIYSPFKDKNYSERRGKQFDKNKVARHFELDEVEIDLIIENMYRLNIFQAPAGEGIKVGDHKFVLRTTDVFEVTTLGIAFIEACKFK